MATLAIYQNPDNPQCFRVALDDGEAGIFELDFSRFAPGEPVEDGQIPATWKNIIEVTEE